jgi:hypothetical protein
METVEEGKRSSRSSSPVRVWYLNTNRMICEVSVFNCQSDDVRHAAYPCRLNDVSTDQATFAKREAGASRSGVTYHLTPRACPSASMVHVGI